MTTTTKFVVRPFKPSDAEAFARLNLRWINEMFDVEPADEQQIHHPLETIISVGGHIAIAEHRGKAIGTGAILPAQHSPDDGRKWMEIVKMATDPAAQGMGVGTAVIANLVAFARDKAADGIWLETNDRLNAATHLYSKAGFEALSSDVIWDTPYQRCNLQMTLEL
ncbi:MAG: GNAT family N-acetyltransferase [Pseudomonadota bacterium]